VFSSSARYPWKEVITVQGRDVIPHAGARLTPAADVVVLFMAVALMLGSAVLLIADAFGAGIAIPLIAVGIALVAIVWTSVEATELRLHRH
jgi:hypothetical protein